MKTLGSYRGAAGAAVHRTTFAQPGADLAGPSALLTRPPRNACAAGAAGGHARARARGQRGAGDAHVGQPAAAGVRGSAVGGSPPPSTSWRPWRAAGRSPSAAARHVPVGGCGAGGPSLAGAHRWYLVHGLCHELPFRSRWASPMSPPISRPRRPAPRCRKAWLGWSTSARGDPALVAVLDDLTERGLLARATRPLAAGCRWRISNAVPRDAGSLKPGLRAPLDLEEQRALEDDLAGGVPHHCQYGGHGSRSGCV